MKGRCAWWFALAVVVLLGLILGTFALPVRTWRTGHGEWQTLASAPAERPESLPRRIWIDTDAACGEGTWTDPDDCLAILALLGRADVHVVGISTVFGNAPLDVTDKVTRELVQHVVASRAGERIAVYRGCADSSTRCKGGSAAMSMRAAIEQGPLTILALGPMTNIAAALRSPPPEARQLHVIAVMGRRPGHRFHPSEGRAAHALLFGHGPVFRDLNFVLDAPAAGEIVAARVPLTLIPYEAARSLLVTQQDLDRIAARGAAGAWVSERSRAWLETWRTSIGLQGFYPFDLAAAMYILAADAFDCARVVAWVDRDREFTRFETEPALLVAPSLPADSKPTALSSARFCTGTRARVDAFL